MINPLQIVGDQKETLDQIKAEWLGAEAYVSLSPRQLPGKRFRFWNRPSPIVALLFSFLSGLATGGYLALFANGRNGGRQSHVGRGERRETFRVAREVAPCLDQLVA